ncbi:hemerythrin domain-containing protein [Hoeflea poritis]|uniref:Hemerythrin domain-containing protein n=1 Tax=Hoeflea poritis TaxID=2993659 RepID=A0ABT4VIF8_9HYPH|nr:hemerythrin domain-containing protein [Hoeflea poritis]MDA4844458.1 hemerythrin domain-containing protein [Hoeflea poritis]
MDRLAQARKLAIAALGEPPPVAQLLAPLDYILSDHFRQRSLCKAVEDLANADDFDREMAEAVLRFMKSDFGLHVIDEEEDLFPLLRRRALPEDDINMVLGALSLEHASDHDDAERIVEGLAQALETRRADFPDAEFAALLKRFAAGERRHLIVENAIVMPLARARLNDDDLRNLGRRMAARRGIDYPEKKHAV